MLIFKVMSLWDMPTPLWSILYSTIVLYDSNEHNTLHCSVSNDTELKWLYYQEFIIYKYIKKIKNFQLE